MKERFTLVLKGHIALSRIRFPAGTTGSALDVLAPRAALGKRVGFRSRHGRHGVGSYLGVHEGAARGSPRRPTQPALRPGMILSNEPGFYKTGEYGIRIENLQYVTQASDIAGGERPMLGFETLTLAPIDRNVIDVSLLSVEERAWLDAYHARVFAVIGPQVEPQVPRLASRGLRADLIP